MAFAGGIDTGVGIAGRSEDQVVDAIAIDVPCTCDRTPTSVTRKDPSKAEAVGAVEGGKLEPCPEASGRAEHHIAFAASVGCRGPYDQIIDFRRR